MGTKKEAEAESWAVCQSLFHLCSPHLPELPPSLTSVKSSMKRPFGRDGGLDSQFRLPLTPADSVKPNRLPLELIGRQSRVQTTGCFIFELSHRVSRFSHNRVDENQSIISITRDICHTFPNTWRSHREAQLLLHGRLFK